MRNGPLWLLIKSDGVVGQRDVANQLMAGEKRIMGVMIESHIQGGRQDLVKGGALEYGKSITDACISFEDTVTALSILGEAVRRRRGA